MLEQMRCLQQEMDRLAISVDEKLSLLRAEVRRGFDEQGTLLVEQAAEQRRQLEEQAAEQRHQLVEQAAEQRRQLEEQAAEQRRQLEEQAAEQRHLLDEQAVKHERALARQAGAFDQSLAGLQDEFGRSRRNQATIWETLIERTAEMRDDLGDLKADTAHLSRRVDDLEQRMAG